MTEPRETGGKRGRGKEITADQTGLRLGRSEVLRSLGHYPPRAQSAWTKERRGSTSHGSPVGESRRKRKRSMVRFRSKDEKGPSPARSTLELSVKGNVEETSDTGWSAHGLSRSHR